jgi:nucleotide-binding universal stress UspA family protein
MMNIMVGYDGSEGAKAGLKLAISHAKAFDGKVYVVTSLEGGPKEELKDIKAAEKNLAHAKDMMDREKVACQIHQLVRGLLPGEDLIKFAGENDIDEIIIGIKKKSKVGKLIFGSTAQYIILNAACPVVSVKRAD